LKKVGLDDKQIEIYLAVLSLKTAKASEIAALGRQSRSHAYIILRELERMGLVSEIEENRIIRFVAEPPQRLLTYLHDRERQYRELQTLIQGAMPVLTSMTSAYVATPRVTTLKGLEGMKQVYRDILVQEFVGMYNAQTALNVFNENIVTMLFGKEAKLYGRDLLVNNEAATRYCKDIYPHDGYAIRLLPQGITFATDTIVYGDVVTLFAFDEENTIIRIENKHIADTFRAWFEVLWQISAETGAQ
jgi:predicted transcriptional regulator